MSVAVAKRQKKETNFALSIMVNFCGYYCERRGGENKKSLVPTNNNGHRLQKMNSTTSHRQTISIVMVPPSGDGL